jgi:predicted NAD/FAD-binding protein
VLTHRRLTVTLFEAAARHPGEARALRDAELSAVGVSALTRKLLAL